MAKVIKCTSRAEAQQKVEAFRALLDTGEQIMAVDEYVCIGKPGDWVETTRVWDGKTGVYKTVIETDKNGETIEKDEDK